MIYQRTNKSTSNFLLLSQSSNLLKYPAPSRSSAYPGLKAAESRFAYAHSSSLDKIENNFMNNRTSGVSSQIFFSLVYAYCKE